MSYTPTLRRRRGFAIIGLPLASVVILLGGLSLIWLVASREAAAVMDGFIAREARRGRLFTCPDRSIGGFPFSIDIACDQPTVHVKIGDRLFEGSLSRLKAAAYLYEPSTIDVVLTGPAVIRDSAAAAADAAPAAVAAADPNVTQVVWDQLHVNLRLLGKDLGRMALDLDKPVMHLADGQSITSDHLELHVGPANGRPPEDHADDLRFTLTRAAIPALDALDGSSAPLDADVTAIVDRLAIGDVDPGPRMVEAWRQAGGTLQLTALTVAKGALHLSASGMLAIDDQHRPAGRLQAGFSGFEPIARRYGLPLKTIAVGNLLAKIFKSDTAPAQADPDALTLPVVLAGGQVAIGPLRTALRVPPLY